MTDEDVCVCTVDYFDTAPGIPHVNAYADCPEHGERTDSARLGETNDTIARLTHALDVVQLREIELGAKIDHLNKERIEARIALGKARTALLGLPQICNYHGDDFGFLGWRGSKPRCNSCKIPFLVKAALDDIDRIRDYRERDGCDDQR